MNGRALLRSLRDVTTRPDCWGAKAAADPARRVRAAIFIVQARFREIEMRIVVPCCSLVRFKDRGQWGGLFIQATGELV
jgi:hypothetical protein